MNKRACAACVLERVYACEKMHNHVSILVRPSEGLFVDAFFHICPSVHGFMLLIIQVDIYIKSI